MLFGTKSASTGMFDHPRIHSVLCFLDSARLGAGRSNVQPLTNTLIAVTLRATARIPYIAGGTYGDEFRPD